MSTRAKPHATLKRPTRCKAHVWSQGAACEWLILAASSYDSRVRRTCSRCGASREEHPGRTEHQAYMAALRCPDCGGIHDEDDGACVRHLRSVIDDLKSAIVTVATRGN